MADSSARPPLSGYTRTAGLIGWPVAHSRSPAIHEAAYAATSLDWRYLAFPVAPGDAVRAVAGMAALGIRGLSVTMPHKAAVIAALDRVTADATALGAVNSIFRDGDLLVGDNTDGGGFVDALRADEGLDVAGMACTVIGAGGAARAVIRALSVAGAERVAVLNRSADRGRVAAALAGSSGRAFDAGNAAAALDGADLVVQATSVGMGDDGGMPFDPALLPEAAVVADLIYHPTVTPLLAAAEAQGLRTVGGLGMLVHQAARQFTSWTGHEAPVAAMARAAMAAS